MPIVTIGVGGAFAALPLPRCDLAHLISVDKSEDGALKGRRYEGKFEERTRSRSASLPKDERKDTRLTKEGMLKTLVSKERLKFVCSNCEKG